MKFDVLECNNFCNLYFLSSDLFTIFERQLFVSKIVKIIRVWESGEWDLYTCLRRRNQGQGRISGYRQCIFPISGKEKTHERKIFEGPKNSMKKERKAKRIILMIKQFVKNF